MKLYQQVSVKLSDAKFMPILESFASSEVITELCTVAESTFSNKVNPKLIANAAAKCQISKSDMQLLIDCLALVLDTAARLSTEPKEVSDCLQLCGTTPELAAKVAAFTAESQPRLRALLQSGHVHPGPAAVAPEFHSLRWRFDVEVASRCLGDQIVPLVKLQLVTKAIDGGTTSHWLQTDPNNLRHMVEQLEAASIAAQTNHAQRIMRYVK